MICKGWDETIEDVEKRSLWLLLLKHAWQWEFYDIEKGKENLDIICWRIGDDGWPNRECHLKEVVLTLKKTMSREDNVGEEVGHS